MDFSDLLNEDSITWEQQVDEENEFSAWFENLFEDYYRENSPPCDQHPSSDDSYDSSSICAFPEVHNSSSESRDLSQQDSSSSSHLETDEDVTNVSWPKLDLDFSNKDVDNVWNISSINQNVGNITNSPTSAPKYFPENVAIPGLLEDIPVIKSGLCITSNSEYTNKISKKNISNKVQYSPYEVDNSPLHDIRNSRSTVLTNLHLKHKEMPKEKNNTQLLVLPNGDVYKKILLPLKNKTVIGQTWNINSNVIDLSYKLQNGSSNNLGSQPPSPCSDSGVSTISWSPQTQSEDYQQVYSQISAQSKQLDPPSYTLNEVLFANPQPKVGILLLTDEEKSTLLMEGYPIPYELPLDKHQERYLKKIRRKIKNKISAQESRRKKKEYADSLEAKMRMYQRENVDLHKKVESLENNNRTLMSQLQMIQNKVQFARPNNGGACFMVLVVFFAVFVGSWDFTSMNFGYNKLLTSTGPVQHFSGRPGLGPNLPRLERSSLEGSQKVLGLGPNIQEPVVENYFTFNVKSWWMFTKENDASTSTNLEIEIHPLPPGALTGDATSENVKLDYESHPTVPAVEIAGNATLPEERQLPETMGTGCN